MERGTLALIQGQKANTKIIPILLLCMALALFLLGITISDLHLCLRSLEEQLCDLRRALARAPLAGQDLKFTGIVSITPEAPPTDASAPPPPRDFQTENT